MVALALSPTKTSSRIWILVARMASWGLFVSVLMGNKVATCFGDHFSAM